MENGPVLCLCCWVWWYSVWPLSGVLTSFQINGQLLSVDSAQAAFDEAMNGLSGLMGDLGAMSKLASLGTLTGDDGSLFDLHRYIIYWPWSTCVHDCWGMIGIVLDELSWPSAKSVATCCLTMLLQVFLCAVHTEVHFLNVNWSVMSSLEWIQQHDSPFMKSLFSSALGLLIFIEESFDRFLAWSGSIHWMDLFEASKIKRKELQGSNL